MTKVFIITININIIMTILKKFDFIFQVTISDGTVRIKSTQTDYQVTCKSILLARTESKYIGGEVSVMENIESYEYMV